MNLLHFRTVICSLLLIFTVAAFGDVSPWDTSTYPGKVQQQLEKAQHAFKEGKFAEALSLYQALTKDMSKLPIAYIGEGDAFAKLGSYPRAIAAFQRALQLISEFPQVERFAFEPTVQAKLATAYHRNKQLDKADE